LHYDIKIQSLLCNNHFSLKTIVEYGQATLAQILQLINNNKLPDNSQIRIGGQQLVNSLDILKLIKVLIEAVEEQREIGGPWIIFHTSTLLYFNKNS
jgi:hypothetical protein